MLLLLRLYLIIFSWCIGANHPFYVSVCQIDHNDKNQSLEITFKIFTDDLELALEERIEDRLFIGSDREASQTDSLIDVYLYEKIQIAVDGQPAQLKYLGKEVEMQVTWCYVEVMDIAQVNEIRVSNKLLLEMYDTQTNLVNIRVGKEKKSMLLNKKKKQDVVAF